MLRAERTEVLEASPEQLWAIIGGVADYPEWNSFFSSVDVRENDEQGRVALAACRHDASVMVLKTELRFEYVDGISVTASGKGNDLRSMIGSFALEAASGATAVTHVLHVEPGLKLGLLLRGPVEDRVRQSLLNRAFAGLRERVAASA